MTGDTVTARRRKKRTKPNEHPSQRLTRQLATIAILVTIAVFVVQTIETQSRLDSLETGSLLRAHVLSPRALVDSSVNHTTTSLSITPAKLDATSKRYLLFLVIKGQGAGNLMNGLLAAHLLADEFDRIVCVTNEFESFLEVFEAIHPRAVEECPKVLAEAPQRTSANKVQLVNFARVANECKVQDMLRDGPDILYYYGNTYPRWPIIPDNYFDRFYRAKPQLLAILPYQKAPTTVVHLREPDSHADARRGLDNYTLQALTDQLPASTFLVTNRVEWYARFEASGWAHPHWNGIVHSAVSKGWGKIGEEYHGPRSSIDLDKAKQNLQLWADWYTMLRAKKVIHTHSDFSISAIHWMDLDSRSIVGYTATSGKLELIDESWRVDGETIPLRDRRVTRDKSRELRGCINQTVKHKEAERWRDRVQEDLLGNKAMQEGLA